MYDNTQQAGWLPRQWARFFGKADPVGSQLKELSRQGLWFSRWAHVCAILMLILFSLGSLVGVAGASTAAFLAAWHDGQFDLIHGIGSSVSAMLVLCMDTGALYAAMVIRMRKARGEEGGKGQWAIIIIADILEAGAFIYMSYLYDVPDLPLVWGLIIARAIAAPIFAIYLSLAQTMPIGAPDMLHMAGMAAGEGLIRDVTLEASDPAASIARKAEIFGAASLMAPRDRSRLDGLITVLQPATPPPMDRAPFLEALLAGGTPYMPPTPPDGGSPVSVRPMPPTPLEGGNVVGVTLLEDPRDTDKPRRPRASKAKASSKPRKRARDTRTDEEKHNAIKAVVLPAMAAGRKVSNNMIARAAGVSTSTASKHRRIIEAEEAARTPANVLPLAR